MIKKMLNLVRNSVNSFYAKIIIFLIAFAFAIGGIGSLMGGSRDFVVVSFPKLKDITLKEFYSEKQDTLRQVQLNYGDELTPEIIESLDLDRKILFRIIRNRLIEEWISQSGIEIDNKTIAYHLKENPNFISEGGKFDSEMFKNFLAKIAISEEVFFEKVKFGIGQKLLDESISRSIHTPKLLTSIVAQHMSEVKTINIFKANLDNKKNISPINPSQKELEEFYLSNKEKYLIPESRNIRFVLINKEMIKLEKPITEEDAKKYFDTHLDEFEGTKFSKEKNNIIKALTSESKEKILEDRIKSLEDHVASGETLDEIAKLFSYKIKSFKGSLDDFKNNPNFLDNADNIFAMEEKEISYPLDLQDENSIIVEVNNIEKEYYPEFKDVLSKIKAEYIHKQYHAKNLEMISKIQSKLNTKNFRSILKKSPYEYMTAQISRFEDKNNNLPKEVISKSFDLKVGDVSDIIHVDNNIYIINVKNSKINKAKAKKFKDNQKQNIDEYFKSGYIEEIIEYFYAQNAPKIKMEVIRSIK